LVPSSTFRFGFASRGHVAVKNMVCRLRGILVLASDKNRAQLGQDGDNGDSPRKDLANLGLKT
jgi:hypothetical protein